jgi:Domain of unknown function (DUF4276)
MIKTAVFVEGQTELVFVRELLLRVFEANDISFRCFRLHRQDTFPAEYDYRADQSSAFYFDLIEVGNDARVQSEIARRAGIYWRKNYFRILGLRDMYSQTYRKISSRISPEMNQRIIDAVSREISERVENPTKIYFHFAIMEVEAWLLGVRDFFEKLDPLLTNALIFKELGYDLAVLNPEDEFFHPANEFERILMLVRRSYDKSKGEINAFMSNLQKDDFIELIESGKCASFSGFYTSIPTDADYLIAG